MEKKPKTRKKIFIIFRRHTGWWVGVVVTPYFASRGTRKKKFNVHLVILPKCYRKMHTVDIADGLYGENSVTCHITTPISPSFTEKTSMK